MDGLETKLVEHAIATNNSSGYIFLLIYGLIEFVKSMLFAKRRKQDEEHREDARCRLNITDQDEKFKCKLDPDLQNKIREINYNVTKK